MYDNQYDPLKELFDRLPGEPLPASFRRVMMHQIMEEAVKVKKRTERLTLLAVICASLFMIALGVLALYYLDVPELELHTLKLPSFSLLLPYVPMVVLLLVLLLGDYWMRRLYYKKHKE